MTGSEAIQGMTLYTSVPDMAVDIIAIDLDRRPEKRISFAQYKVKTYIKNAISQLITDHYS